jgi:RNA polymerase sigma-70 factor (ECF subfamily)
MTQKPDSVLIEAVLQGNTDSFGVLCQRYYPALVAIAHSVLGDRHLAEDAAQEALAKACRKLDQLKNKDKFAGWLAVICRNVARDMARQKEKLTLVENLSLVADDTARDELCTAVRLALSEFTPAERELIFLRYYEGMKYEQISAVLGISSQAINGRLRRARKKIAQYLRRNGYIEVNL